MKYFVIIVLLLCSFQLLGQKRDTIFVQNDTVVLKRDTAIRNDLLKIDLKDFVGKTAEEFLKHPTISKYKSYFFSNEPPGVLYSLLLVYARGLYIEIFAYPIKYQPGFSKSRRFDFELYKKETITKIKLDRSFFENNVVREYTKQ